MNVFKTFNTLQRPLESDGGEKKKNGLIEKMKNALRSKTFLVLNYLSHFKEDTLWHLAIFRKHLFALFLWLVAFLVLTSPAALFFSFCGWRGSSISILNPCGPAILKG